MVLHLGGKQHQIKVLLDTGCSVALLNKQTAEKLGVEKKKHKQARSVENFTGEEVKGATQYYTRPMRPQHHKHYSWEKFKISPMEADIDAFLPFSWIAAHPPQGAWTNEAIRFSGMKCIEKCTRNETDVFSLTWDEVVAINPDARILGYAATVTKGDPLDDVPLQFRQHLGIMSKEATDALMEQWPYDCKINLREGETALWGPIYPLLEAELQTLREWLKEMERTGKIRRSTSPAGSPILFVPKPHR